MDFVKRFLPEIKTRDRIKDLGGEKILLLLALNLFTKFWPISLSFFPMKLVKEIIQKL